MMQQWPEYKLPLALAVGLHVILLILLLVSFALPDHSATSENQPIQAVIITADSPSARKPPTATTVPAPLPQQQVVPPKPVLPPPSRETKPASVKTTVPPAAQPEPAPQPKPQLKPLPEPQKQASTKPVATTPPPATTLKKQHSDSLEQQLQQELQQEAQALQQAKAKQRHQALEKLLQQQLLAEAQSKAPAERQTQAAARPVKNAAATGQSAAQTSQVLDKYKAQIKQAIARYWLIPEGSAKNLSCELAIRLAPGGAVLTVKIVQSSGDAALDRSARTAVLKASPLPVPQGALFEQFREINLTMKPEEIL